MNYTFVPMNQAYATTMVEHWKYEDAYAIYDYSHEAEHLLDTAAWGTGIFAVLDDSGELMAELSIEFFDAAGQYTAYDAYKNVALINQRELWVGFGLHPDLVGQGLGAEFVTACVDYAVQHSHYHGEYARLGVALFNKRAIKAYEKAGFEIYEHSTGDISGQTFDCVYMRKNLRVTMEPAGTEEENSSRRKFIQAILLDCGDTLADEGTEIKDATGTTLRADLIPGAAELLHELKRRGYTLALVADGPVGTFQNILTQHSLYDCFDVFAISEQVGVDKPDARMFIHALEQLGIHQEDYGRVVMVGNNLARDIKGANALGLISVWLNWSPRRSKVPADASEVPQYTLETPLDLIPILEALDA